MQKKIHVKSGRFCLHQYISQNPKEKKNTHNYVSSPISLQIALSCDVLTDFFSKLLCKLTNKTTTNNKKKVKDKECAKLESSHSFVRVTQFVHEIQIVRARAVGRSEKRGA